VDRFAEITWRCSYFMLDALNGAMRNAVAKDKPGSAALVKTQQALALGKVVVAVGIFSIFEARLQDGLRCRDSFSASR